MSRHRQSGAALVVSLTFVAAIALLATAAMREIAFDTTVTANLSASAHARLATLSGIEMTLAESKLPQSGEMTRQFAFGPNAIYETTVVVRYLGEHMRHVFGEDANVLQPTRQYEVFAQTLGPKNANHQRRLYWFAPVPDDS